MKKILHIAEPFAAGVLSFFVDITKKQVERYEVWILWGERPLTPPNVELLFDKRVHLVKIKSFRGAVRSLVNPRAYLEVRKWYNKIKPDIVHLHSSASGFVGRWALPCNVPMFYTPHGFSFLMKGCSFMKRDAFWFAEYLSAKRKCTIVACGDGEYREALKLTKRATYVNNGINLDGLDAYMVSSSKNRHPVKICTCGRILYQKNPALFNKIAELLPDIEFVWIGDGELKSELTSKNITITGWLDRDSVLKTIQGCDFFVLPSLWEGLPISLLEAMFLKKICIVSNVIGNKDVIHPLKNGMICTSAENFVTVIKQFVDGSLDGRKMAEQASRDVLENFNSKQMADKYSAVYSGMFVSK